jgi:hypothetical protein
VVVLQVHRLLLEEQCCLTFFFLPFVQGKAMHDPEIQNILTDPVMRQVISHQMFAPLS